MIVAKAGRLVAIKLRPYDLRRHSATYASRSGVPIEIVSKVILRHANLSSTQRYLGTISDDEAIKWIEKSMECVQQRLAFSVGVSPTRAEARDPVARMADRRETKCSEAH